MLSKGDEPMNYFGRILDEGGVEPTMDDEDDGFHGGVQLQPGGELQPGGDLHAEQDLRPEEVQGDQLHQGEGHDIAIPLEAEIEDEKVVIGEIELTKHSAIRDLRNGCRYLGVSQAGSKEKLFNRILVTFTVLVQ